MAGARDDAQRFVRQRREVEAVVLQRIGEADSTSLEMSFDRVPLVVDSTLCVAPKAAPDTLAPTPATVP
jgi:hypothetical protein